MDVVLGNPLVCLRGQTLVRLASACSSGLHSRHTLFAQVLLVALVNLGLQCLLIYAPGVQDVFGLAAIDGIAWLRCIFLAVVVFLIVELEKWAVPKFIRPLLRPCLARVENAMFPARSA